MIIPEDYHKLDPLPEDPEGSVSYGKQTDNAVCLVYIYPIAVDSAMDFSDKQALIDGIHRTLAENQAIIEVDNGTRISGKPYIYSIIKTYHGKEAGVVYTLTMDLLFKDSVIRIQAFFQEYGTTGIRDTAVYAQCYRSENDFSPEKWFFDPYDLKSQAAYKMNKSELAEYDDIFPDHPLSQCRSLIKYYVDNF